MTPRPVTVLYFLTELQVGGAERNLYELARNASKAGFRPIVAALVGSGPIAAWLADSGVPVYDLNLRSPIDVGCFFRLVGLLKRERVDILHSFLFHPNLMGRIAAVIARTPVVISSARVAEHARPWRAWLEGATSCLIDVETCVSDSVRHFTHTRAGIPLRKLLTIRNGVDLSRFTVTRAEARRLLEQPDPTCVVTFVGRFARQKGADLIPRIAKRVHDRFSNVRFLLVGTGPLEPAVRTECVRMGLSDSVLFLGRRDDVPVILAASDVLMLPSRWEGLANVILEAQAAGAVVVATDVEGTREAIEPGQTGVVVARGRPEVFADAVILLLGDTGRRLAIADAARSRAGESLTVDRMVEANFRLYHTLLEKNCRKHR